MDINVSSGQTKSGIVVTSSDVLRVGSGGTVIATRDAGQTQIAKGAHASATTVLSGGYFQNEGRATGTIVSAGGFDGNFQRGSEIRCTDGGFFEVFSGTALMTSVVSGGTMDVLGNSFQGRNASVSATSVAFGGYLIVSGGSSVNAVLQGGIETVSDSGSDSGATVDRGGLLFVQGGSATNVTIASGGAMVLAASSGAQVSADHVMVASGGIVAVVGQAATSDITLAGGAKLVSTGVLLVASKGAVAAPWLFGHTVGFGETEYVLSGGTAIGATVAGGSLTIEAGGIVTKTMVTGGGRVALAGGTLDLTTLGAGGSLSGIGVTSNLMVAGGSANYGGTARHDTVAGGFLRVSGTALGNTISGGSATLEGTVSATVVGGGSAYLGGYTAFSEGSVTDTTVTGGTVTLTGSSAVGTRVSGGIVDTQAVATSDTKVFSGGVFVQDKPSSGATIVTGTVVESGGRLVLEEAPSFIVQDTLDTTIAVGGTIDFTTVGYVAGATAYVKRHTLIVNGSRTVKLGLVGGYDHVQFLATSDGSGGTLVVEQPFGAMAVPLAQDVGSAGAQAIARDLTPGGVPARENHPGGWVAHVVEPVGAAPVHAGLAHPVLALSTHAS